MRLCVHQFLSCLAFLVLTVGTAAAVTNHDATEALEFPLSIRSQPAVYETQSLVELPQTRAAVLDADWRVQTNRITGTVHAAYGGDLMLVDGGVREEAQAAAAAREFLASHTGLLGTRTDNLELQAVVHSRGKWAVHYRQIAYGLPVTTGSAFVVIGDSGRLMAFGSDFFPEGHDSLARPALTAAEATLAAANALGGTPRSDRPEEADLVCVPAPGDEVYELRAAYRVVFESEAPFGKWESFVDAVSGEILGRQNLYRTGDVFGDVHAIVQDTGYCDGQSTRGIKNMNVTLSGVGTVVTDEFFEFLFPDVGSDPLTITAEFRGPFFNVNRATGLGADALYTGTAVPGVAHPIFWDGTNARQDERDTFFNANRVHDFMKSIDPTFTELDYSMPVAVGRTDFYCPGNAWWDGTGMNFCEAGSGYANTGEMGNVVYHEYGHGVTQELYLKYARPEPPSDIHEGNSDIIAVFNDRESIIGRGFYVGNCTGGIRDLNNSLRYPEDLTGSGHHDGQIIGGVIWDAWQSLLATYPQAVADSIAWYDWHYSRDLGGPQTQPDQVLWTFIADDDDANLDNGTPNYDHLCLGATNHGFDCPEILTGVIIQHTPLGHTEDGSAGFDVMATITSTETTLNPAMLLVYYRVNGGSYTDLLMSATGNPDEFSAHLPALSQNSEVEYYIYAEDMNGNNRSNPPTAPTAVHAFDVAYEYDDLESGVAEWTAGVPGDDATTGVWEVCDPIGTAAQPEYDATADPGVNAFITGQCSGPNCPTGCTLGCNDVDSGTTTLLSPVYDLSTATQATIKYDRWYSNSTGSNPGSDYWVVDVSNDGGSNWTNVENTNTSAHSWTTIAVDVDALFGTPGLVQLRFRASDLGSGSLVEAGVDDIRILAAFGGVGVDEVAQAPVAHAFALTQNQPNPFGPATRIEYSLPQRSGVHLAVYNVSGQKVRTLANGPREAGRYQVSWDGRDAAGQRVAAGVYFYRLEADFGTLTKKMTVLK
jgi:Zn-dependent metalloprotease